MRATRRALQPKDQHHEARRAWQGVRVRGKQTGSGGVGGGGALSTQGEVEDGGDWDEVERHRNPRHRRVRKLL